MSNTPPPVSTPATPPSAPVAAPALITFVVKQQPVLYKGKQYLKGQKIQVTADEQKAFGDFVVAAPAPVVPAPKAATPPAPVAAPAVPATPPATKPTVAPSISPSTTTTTK